MGYYVHTVCRVKLVPFNFYHGNHVTSGQLLSLLLLYIMFLHAKFVIFFHMTCRVHDIGTQALRRENAGRTWRLDDFCHQFRLESRFAASSGAAVTFAVIIFYGFLFGNYGYYASSLISFGIARFFGLSHEHCWL